jgi:hypothetical protein
MKKLFLLIVLLLVPVTVSAHQLATDGSIGAVVHIDPSDDPIVGQASGFYFDFEDRTSKFQLGSCLCTVIVQQNGTTLESQQLSQASLTTASFSYTFAAKGVYQIKIIGVPQPSTAFQPFSLSYDIRVARDAQTANQKTPDWVWALVVGAVAALGAFAYKRKNR